MRTRCIDELFVVASFGSSRWYVFIGATGDLLVSSLDGPHLGSHDSNPQASLFSTLH